MILYENGYIRLDYCPSTDILYAECPDIYEYDLLQLHQAFSIIVETIRGYDIKYFILDFTKTHINVSQEDYRVVMSQFARDLMTTRLQKLARIATRDTARENKVEEYAKKVKEETKSEIPFRNFTSRAAATDWLTGKQAATIA